MTDTTDKPHMDAIQAQVHWGSGRIAEEQRRQTSKQAKGKTIESMEWEPEDSYWVITFTDNSEMCVRLMAESSADCGEKMWGVGGCAQCNEKDGEIQRLSDSIARHEIELP